MAINPNASQQGGLNQVAAQGNNTSYRALTPEEIKAKFGIDVGGTRATTLGYDGDTINWDDVTFDAEGNPTGIKGQEGTFRYNPFGGEYGSGWVFDTTRAVNGQDLSFAFSRAGLEKHGYQKIGSGDSGVGAWYHPDTGEVLLMGDSGKKGGGYGTSVYRTDLDTFNKAYFQGNENRTDYIRGATILPDGTLYVQGDKTNGDIIGDIVRKTADPLTKQAVGQTMRGVGGALSKSNGALGQIGTHLKYEGEGIQRGEDTDETAARMAREDPRGLKTDVYAGQVAGQLGNWFGPWGRVLAVGISGGAGSRLEAGRRAQNIYGNQQGDPYGDAIQREAVAYASQKIGQAAGAGATSAGYGQYAGAASRLGSDAFTTLVNDGDMGDVLKRAVISYFTGMDPRVAQAWQAYQTAKGWKNMSAAQRANAALSFYRQYGGSESA